MPRRDVHFNTWTARAQLAHDVGNTVALISIYLAANVVPIGSNTVRISEAFMAAEAECVSMR